MAKLKARKNTVVRTAVLFAFSVLALLGAAAPAGAASVGLWYYGTLYYVASPGETNNLTVSQTPNSFAFADPTATISPQYGCTATDVHHAVCPSGYVRYVYIKTGDSNDTIDFQPTQIQASIDCGGGIDTLLTPDPNAKPVNCEYVNPPAAPAPEAPAPLSIVQPVTTMTKAGKVPLTLGCSTAATTPCVGTITFELPKAKKSQVVASRRGGPNILGHQKITVQRGKRRRVKVAMTGKGRRLVKRHRKLAVIARLTVTEGGRTQDATQSLTINAPR